MQELAGTGSGFPDRVLPRQQKGFLFRTPAALLHPRIFPA